MDSATVLALVGIAIAVGIGGTVVPFVPGLPLVALAALGYGLAEGFGTTGAMAFVVILAMGIAGTAAGVLLPSRAAGGAGAPRSSLFIGAVGAVVGFFVVPVIGLPLGGIVGIYAAERVRTQDGAAAWRTTRAAIRGFGLGALAQLAAGVLMGAVWLTWVLAT